MKTSCKTGLITAMIGAACLSAAPAAFALNPHPGAKLRALEKITGEATDIEVESGETVAFGGIMLTVRACYQSPPEEQPPESAAYIEVISSAVNPKTGSAADKDPRLFAGWMFASSPGRNALEHSLYDVWVISCTALPPVIEEPLVEGEDSESEDGSPETELSPSDGGLPDAAPTE